MGKIGHSESFWAISVGIVRKVVNRAKLANLSHSDSLWIENLENCELGKIAVLSPSEPIAWEKIIKVVNQTTLAIPSHSEPLW